MRGHRVGTDEHTVVESSREMLWTLLGIGSAALVPLTGRLLWARRRQAAGKAHITASRSTLEANEARLRAILDHVLDSVISTDRAGVVTEWSAQAEQTFGFTKQDAVGTPLHRLIIPEGDREAHRKDLSTYMHTDQPAMNRRFQVTAVHKDGHAFPVEMTVIPLPLGDTLSFCIFLRDITEEHRAQQALKDSQAFLSSIVDNLPTMVFVKDAQDLRFLRVNKAAEDILGLSEAQLIGLNDYDLLPKEQADLVSTIDRAVLESGQLQDTPEEPIHTKHKGLRILHTKKLAIFDGQARPRYLLGISEDITERKKAEDALRRSQHSAEAANRAKTEFLANVSHEIRTPLNAVLGMLDLLSKTTANPEQREYAEVGQRAGRVLLQLVTDLLDMAKMEARTLQLYVQPFNVKEFLLRTQSLIRPRAHEKGLALDLVVSDEVPTRVEGDLTRIQQILLNLLGNAIKFTAQGGVTLTVHLVPAQGSEPCQLQFAVKDTGIGIAVEHQDRIFDRFTQIESGDNRTYGGTGLGLPISLQLAELMGGTIQVESRVGDGSTFLFRMPCRPAAADVPSTPAPGGFCMPAAQQVSAPSEPPLHVLVVDDFAETLQLVKAYLKDRPYTVDLVNCGEAAIERHRASRYQLILMDMQMPGMDGYAATRAFRETERVQGRNPVPVIAMTADVSDSARTRSVASGCSGFLGKPFTQTMLVQVIQRYALPRKDADADGLTAALPQAAILDSDLQNLRQAFISNRRGDVGVLKAALTRCDFETIQTIGHRIRGLAGSYELEEIGTVGSSIEQAAQYRDSEAVGRHIEELETLLATLG